VEKNIREAETVSLAVWRAGAVGLCPHTNTRFFDGECTDETWIEGTKELLTRSDAILLLPRWRCSSGSIGESVLAAQLDMPIFNASHISDNPDHLPFGLIEWINE